MSKSKFQIIYIGARGGRSTIKRAVAFQIFYGRKKILSGEFGRKKAQSTRLRFLNELMSQIYEKKAKEDRKRARAREKKLKEKLLAEKKKAKALRLSLLEKKKAAKIKEQERGLLEKDRELQKKLRAKDKAENQKFKAEALEARKNKKRIDKLLKNKVPVYLVPHRTDDFGLKDIATNMRIKMSEQEQKRMNSAKAKVMNDVIDYTGGKFEETEVLKNIAYSSVFSLPYKPKSDYWKKEVIVKDIIMDDGEIMKFTTFLYTLPPKRYIRIADLNFLEAIKTSYIEMGYNLFQFFKEFKNAKRGLILRIKFVRQLPGGALVDQGISLRRQYGIETWKELRHLFLATFLKMKGIQGKGFKTTDYLAGDDHIYISGISLEYSNIREEHS